MNYEYSQTSMQPVSRASVDTRADFITRTYAHLFGAIFLFAAFEAFMFKTGIADSISQVLLTSRFGWFAVLGGFMVVGWFASRVAMTAESMAAQYAALIGFVIAEAIIFTPLLWIANHYYPGLIGDAALITALGFTGLTAIAYYSRRDFSFLGGILKWGFMLAIVAIIAGALFGFQLGMWFSIAMIGLAGGAILYDTSNILRHYPADRHVGAALQLFAAVAMLFWYVLRLLMSLQSD